MCPQGQRKVSHSTTGHGSIYFQFYCLCAILCCAHLCERKSRLVWNRWKTGPLKPVSVIIFQQSSPFFIRPFIPDMDTRAHTLRSITSKPYYTEPCITAAQSEKHRLVLNGTNTCAHTYLTWGNGCRWHLHTPSARWHHTYFHSHTIRAGICWLILDFLKILGEGNLCYGFKMY